MSKALRATIALAVVGAIVYFAIGGIEGLDELRAVIAARVLAVPLWVPLAVVALLVGGVAARRAGGRGNGQTDPVRMYPSVMRAQVFARAGGQCEYTGWAWQRCRAKAEHADHILPWSKGGATSLQNGAASCAHHNTSKGAKLLTGRQTRALERRRRRYFPPGTPVKAGQRYGEPGIAAPAARAAAAAVEPVVRPMAAPTAATAPAASATAPSWERDTPIW
ncbi:HNH endonuclease [Pseudactinotalea terrae]|uniref:HNH endonuclease n=1 Tax=Pseudactinotalea terrae TaxID=1743262 RepID=UPI0013913D2F|nr:HNH endonuclease signature motif containing protein [Pseudactinotalea terrae]